jgi:hypothetical protein
MLARTQVTACAVAVGLLIGPAIACAQSRNADITTRAAANKSQRATRPAQRSRVLQDSLPAPDDRKSGTDPDAAIRFQLKRDSMGM